MDQTHLVGTQSASTPCIFEELFGAMWFLQNGAIFFETGHIVNNIK